MLDRLEFNQPPATLTFYQLNPTKSAVAPDRNTLLIFTHIPKTGGLNLETHTASAYQLNDFTWHRCEGTIYGQKLEANTVNAMDNFQQLTSDEFHQSHALSGHLPFGIHAQIDRPCVYLGVIRDPVKQAISHYKHGLDHGYWDSKSGLSDLIKQRHMVTNPQTRQLAGVTNREDDISQDTVNQAMDNIEKHYNYIDITEQSDNLTKRLLGDRNLPPVIASRWNQSASRLSETKILDLTGEAKSLHALDFLLYEKVTKLISERKIQAPPIPSQPDLSRVIFSSPDVTVNGLHCAMLEKPDYQKLVGTFRQLKCTVNITDL